MEPDEVTRALDAEPAFTEAQRAAYRRDGHLQVRGFLAPAVVAAYRPAVRAAFERYRPAMRPMAERDAYGQAFTQALNLGLREPAVRPFAHARRFASAAAQLLGVARVRIFADEGLFKEPGGGPTPWHQDQTAFPLDTDAVVTLWIPLVDVARAMGTLVFADGSHRDGVLGPVDISAENDVLFARTIAARGFTLTDVGAMAVGDVSFHAGCAVHRAHPNATTTVREAFSVHYFADGARVRTANDSQARALALLAPELAPGAPAACDAWPRVLPRDA